MLRLEIQFMWSAGRSPLVALPFSRSGLCHPGRFITRPRLLDSTGQIPATAIPVTVVRDTAFRAMAIPGPHTDDPPTCLGQIPHPRLAVPAVGPHRLEATAHRFRAADIRVEAPLAARPAAAVDTSAVVAVLRTSAVAVVVVVVVDT